MRPLEVECRRGQKVELGAASGARIDVTVHEIDRRGALLIIGGDWVRVAPGSGRSHVNVPSGGTAAVECVNCEACQIVAADGEITVEIARLQGRLSATLEITGNLFVVGADAEPDEPAHRPLDGITPSELLDAEVRLRSVDVRGQSSRERVIGVRELLQRLAGALERDMLR